MPDQAPHPESNGAELANDPRWARLVAEWFEEQAALFVSELEPAGEPSGERPESAPADHGR